MSHPLLVSLERAWRGQRNLVLFAIAGLALVLARIVFGLEVDPAFGLLAAGPTVASLREEALSELMKAKALTEPDGTVKAENEDAFNAAMQAFAAKDQTVASAAKLEGNQERLSERMAYYTGKATGTPMRFNQTQLDPSSPKSLGQQFVESPAYKQLTESGVLASENSKFRSDPVVAAPHLRFMGAATDVIQTETGGPGAGLVTPFYLPGILPLPQAPTVVRSLFPNEPMTAGDTVSYAAQVGFDNAAAAVAQATAVDGSGVSGGVKPQSSIAWERRTAPAEWIATWMAATRQGISDVSQMRSLIDNQGRLMIRIEEDDQLLNGNGTPPNISGIRDQGSLQTLDLTGEDNLDGIRTARRLVKTGVSRLDATFIVVNPIDSEEVDLLKDNEGLYRGGNPIGNFVSDQPIWRLRRAESEAIPEGIALVGAGAGATVFERQPITVLTADQHADFFVRNIAVILFEERLAFPVYFPTAFVEITLGDWSPS